ncbi:choline dehydrogenase 7 [Phytophthora boehmeriae]|uniref:Choline dehydrogenase 7 n=1 Tax=Phytophthora boehmeriae TaxID=109152 RepID=A0A8T1WN43_9STRA|nr:choline dehydrogenase 7 [Phytophthora boehmeriae]
MAMRSASKMAETIELSSSESDSDLVVDGATIKPRPKLRTRRSPLEESPEVARPPKRVREASKKAALQFSDEDEEDEEEEEDNDETENYVDQVETPSSDEQLPEEDTRRRSGRARKQVQSVIDLSDDDFMDSSSEELEEAPKPKKKKTAKSKPKSKPKKKKRKRSSSNSSDDDADYGSEVEFVGNAGANGVNPDSDGFIIDKVLAREVHTMKEWKKMCANKNTRFLTHCSIFMPDEEEEEQKEERKASTGEQKQDGDSNTSEKQQVGDAGTTDKQQDESISIDEQKQQRIDTSAVANDALTVASAIDVEEEDAGEERFLIKWKKLSYLHTSWQTENELLETDKNAKGKIQRFREKELRDIYSQNVHGDEYYSPEFRIVDRILEIRDRPLDDFSPDYVEEDSDKKLQYFLVKWKALPYDDITWEREDDVGDDAAVEQYNNRIIRAAKRFKKVALAKHTPQTNKRKLNFRGYTAESPPPCKKEQSFQLRDYQLTGVNWMLFNWYQKRNSMLADEMGLGKTVQTVMYINHLAVVERVPQPFIIVAPLSTLGHWQREFDSWTNLNAVVYHGSAAAREVLQNYEFFLSEDELLRAEKLSGKVANTNGKKSSPRPKRNCYRFDVLITTYEMASATDLYKLAQIDWQLMVVDEAHRLKNRNSKLSNILHTRFRFENMLLLTGTPLQNNVEELWVLLNFLDQKKFQSKEDFLESFGELTDSTQVERLHSELKPYLLRRMKEDVEKSLAPKEETIIEVELTVLQKQYYRAIYEKNTEFLARGGRKGDTPSLMNVLMELRKCCNHPFLVKGVEEREIRRISQQKSETKEDIQRQISESLVNSSGKLVLLDKLLPRLKETNHRVLIFSQFKIMLDIVQDYLALRRYNCERIDGNITGNERQSAIDRFCRKDSNAFIMLLSTRAGGVGINLTAADTVIIYDSDWNPQNDLQAQARCHRIGQKKSVKIYRLLTSKTYELQMFHKASLKLGLDQAVLGGMQSDDPVAKLKGQKKQSNPNARMSKEEIENLLKHGAYEIFKEQESEAEAASRKFGEESIDQILSRSTTIVHDPTQNPDGSAKKNAMSSFSKATFVSSANPDEEVDVDDPNFWTKVIGLKGVEEQKKEEPSPLKKRRCRRNVKSYLLDDSGDEFGTSSRKKPSFGKVTKDEEFVISDDDDDDDDDDSDAALAPDDFLGIGGAKKRKRSKVPVAPIYAHTERIVELLTSFGYGRWDDMVRHSPSLQVYSAKEMRKFVQDYILNLLRVSTALSVFSRIGLDLEPSQVYIVSNVPPPVHGQDAGPLDRYGHELKSASRRYKFFDAMTKDMGSPNLLGVAVPPRMWVTDLSARSARLFRPKLQQIDTVYKLTQFVRQKFIPTAPLIDLIKDLQKVGDEAAVQEMIDLGTLPPAADDASEVKVVSASRDSTSANTASDTDARAASADNEHSAPTESSPNEDNADPTLENPSSSKPSEVAPGTEIPSENPPANTPTTESSTSEAQSDKTTGATGTFDSVGDENAKTGNGDSAQLSSSEKSVEMGAVANGVKADGKHPDEKDTVMNDASSARAFNAPSAAKLKAETKTDDAKATGSLQKDREQAMKTLQSLQHLDSPESILVLPPGQLVEVVSRVVRAQGASTDYPHWWSSPRHDILLLQGVECYGLDEHLAAVWKLPLFNSANTASHFPTTTWVENYVTALSIACRNLIVKAREYRTPEDAYAKSSDDEAAEAVAEEEAPPADTTYGDPKHSDPTQDVSETRRRIRDIRGMREEDPYFAPTVRLRQLIETNAARDQQAAAQSRHRESKESSPEKEIARTSKDESKSGNLKSDEMLPRPSHTEKKSHTQDVSERVLKVRLEETKRNESKAATKQVVSAASNGKKRLRSFDKASSSPRLIHIDDDEKEDKDSDDDSSVSSPPRSRSSSSSQSAHNVVQGPAAAAVAAAKAERQQSAVRPWDVIVIDDSEADSD